MPHYTANNPVFRFTITPLTTPPMPVPTAFVEQMLLLAVQERLVLDPNDPNDPNDALAPLRGSTILAAPSMQDAAVTFGMRTSASMQVGDRRSPADAWEVEMMGSTWWRWTSPHPHAVLGLVRTVAGGPQWFVEWPTVGPAFRGDVWIEFTVSEMTFG
jgi:hypothetical protein